MRLVIDGHEVEVKSWMWRTGGRQLVVHSGGREVELEVGLMELVANKWGSRAGGGMLEVDGWWCALEVRAGSWRSLR